MDVKISQSRVCGEVQIPPSKSVAHRKMIGAALAGCTLDISGGGKDMLATERCLKGLAPYIASRLKSDGREYANARAEFCDLPPVLNAGESGSTLRFLLPIACALGANVVFDGEGRLKERPLDGLIDALIAHGAVVEKMGVSQLPLRVSGALRAGEFRIDGSVSSQYVTGLLFALPLLDGDSKIVVEGDFVSKSYVDITLGVLKEFGIEIAVTETGYFVGGNQSYKMPSDLSVEGDWSSAGFMLALGTLAGETRLKGLDGKSLQGDKVVVDLLRQAGADVAERDGVYIAKKSTLHAIDFDAKDCPDAVPIMATALSFAEGDSHIYHVDRLRVKESDRLAAVRKMLNSFGIETEYENDVLTVRGGEHKPCEIDGFNDHRMAMSAIVCALASNGESRIRGVECIDKSYPSFLADLAQIGVNMSILQ
ncbi:MAG: 3-phosphoshikimate 1-carboxyvinyltransferase [Bacteroides sp.]|nr:3-phosphoshikimate 1-carboxyvinyltransferase [Bacillota bacterium]MCM1393672.1 3-phosphoshikimate 1-carboxyvinyltransferase [[Eubacterium] siraeum]MCM1455229.1 3-phosphoshikimate 1-carboxyvinyltransferase [Bacteroides sp.]